MKYTKKYNEAPPMVYDGPQIMPYVNGISFRCDCGGNVFTTKNPDASDPPNTVKCQCNSCRSFYVETDE